MSDGMALVLLLLGAVAALYAAWQLAVFARNRGPGHGRGTPGYARARDARRYAAWSLAAAVLLLAGGCLRVLGSMGTAP